MSDRGARGRPTRPRDGADQHTCSAQAKQSAGGVRRGRDDLDRRVGIAPIGGCRRRRSSWRQPGHEHTQAKGAAEHSRDAGEQQRRTHAEHPCPAQRGDGGQQSPGLGRQADPPKQPFDDTRGVRLDALPDRGPRRVKRLTGGDGRESRSAVRAVHQVRLDRRAHDGTDRGVGTPAAPPHSRANRPSVGQSCHLLSQGRAGACKAGLYRAFGDTQQPRRLAGGQTVEHGHLQHRPQLGQDAG